VKYVSERALALCSKEQYIFRLIVLDAESVLKAPTNLLYDFDLFYNNWKRRICNQIITHNIACHAIRIATKNETKQTRHHRNMKRSLLINPILNKQVKRSRFLFIILSALFWLWPLKHWCTGVHIFGDEKNVRPNFILFFQISYKQQISMLRLKCTIVNKQDACMPNYFICYSSKRFYSINHLLFTQNRVIWNGGLLLDVPNFKIFLILPKFQWGCFSRLKFDLGCWNLLKCSWYMQIWMDLF